MAGRRVGTRGYTRVNMKSFSLFPLEHGGAPEPARVVVNRSQTL
jgi:hypothetical protein